MAVAVRLLGGCIADGEWLKACQSMYPTTGQVPQPIARLTAAIKTPRELAVHESVSTEAAWATEVLKKAGDSMENPSSQWTFRLNRADIKNDAQALVLFGALATAAKDAEDKQNAKAKLKKRKALAKLAAAGAKAAAKAKVKSAADKAKTLRGVGICVESFACTVATFV